MFDLNQIKVLHIEPTTVCQAACPQCAREDLESYDDTKHRTELSLAAIQQLIPENVVANLDKMFMCGNFGDPAAAKECLEIYQWFREVNPQITLGMNTNGALKNAKWWHRLGKLFCNPKDYVVFSIDGLEDTNHIYRRNVSWKKLIENAQAFIDAGGSAHWDMLIFEHNEHQIDLCEQLAKQIGFRWFRCKVSKRFFSKPIDFLHPPKKWNSPNVSKPTSIDCHAHREQSMFLAANGKILPCCWIGSYIFRNEKDLNQALDTKNFQGVIDSWNSQPLSVCSSTCGINQSQTSNFDQQWQREIQF